MSSHIPFRISLLMLLGGLAAAIGTVFLLNFLLSGPVLGFHYDFLVNYKQPNVSREILVIETDDIIESGDIFSTLIALTEMEASNFVLAGRVSPTVSPIMLTETEVRRRFLEEYDLLGSNIKNLFEGIRLGTVNPAQAPLFVEQVVELSFQGRDRLISALVDRDEDLIRSAAVFGNYLQADRKIQTDSDGKLRRVRPLDPDTMEEHPVYTGLKNRYAFSRIESSGGHGPVLWLRSHSAKDIDIHLDKNGNIITDANVNLRRISVDIFRRYKETEMAMYSAMEQANEHKAFSLTSPDMIPLFIYDRSLELLEELLRSPNAENRALWIASRRNFISSLDLFFSGSAEYELIKSIEDEIADTDPFYIEIINALVLEKNNLIPSFILMRNLYDELSMLYSVLRHELEQSFCIMGPSPNAEYSALLANILITGSHIKPADERSVIFWSVISSLVILLFIFLLRPVILLPAGIFLSLLSALVFTGVFTYFSYWIDPLISLSASLSGTLIIFFAKCAYFNYRARTFKYAYRTSVPKDTLKDLINSGYPRLSQITNSYTAVIAIKDPNLLGREDKENSSDAGRVKRAFYSAAKRFIFNAGAVVAGYEGDTILACFGSPIDKSYHPVTKACGFVKGLLKSEKISWHFGIDAGNCSFFWSAETGFTVTGRPAVRARILVNKTVRFKTRSLVTNSVLEKIHKDGKKIGAFNDESGAVFELL
ncbi:MAG: hypothetical protein FWC21_04215 [Treponema sp.]|nr:hypothetical protein [Treponema sp.]